MVSAARVFFLSFALSVFGAGPVYAADTCESLFGLTDARPGARLLELFTTAKRAPTEVVTNQVLRETRILLGSMGVRGGSISIGTGGEFDLLATAGNAKLNQFAAQVMKAYGVRVISFPGLLVKEDGEAGVLRLDLGRGPESLLVIGPATVARVARGGDPMRDPDVLHELRHLKSLDDLAKKKANAVYGEVFAKVGRIPDKMKVSPEAYARYMSFDEMKTYHQQAKQQLQAANVSGARASIGHGFTVSNRTRTVARLMAEALGLDTGILQATPATPAAPVAPTASTEVKMTFVKTGDVTAAHFAMKSASAELEVTLPLVNSKGEDDPRNQELVKDQVARLLKVSTAANDQFIKAGQLLNQGHINEVQAYLNPQILN